MEAAQQKLKSTTIMTENNGRVKTPISGDISQFSGFVIANYIHLLDKPEKGDKDKYICPNCSEPKLSIQKSGPKKGIAYDCYGCHDTKVIAYKLQKLNGDFNKKPDNSPTQKSSAQRDPLQVYKEIKEFVSGEIDDDDQEDKLRIIKPEHTLSLIQEIIKGKELKYNLRSKEIELQGKVLNLDTFRMKLQKDRGIFIKNRDIMIEALYSEAKDNEYDPIKLFLEQCYRNYDPEIDENFDIAEVCQVLFGTHEPLYCQYFYRWLIGLVKRIWEPGCKFDEAFVLQGEPACYKSTFFKTLGGEYFTDAMLSIDKDGLLTMAKNWIIEWSELDKMTAKTYHGIIKAFLSRSDDFYREPYAREAMSHPRCSMIVGSTNRDNFLNDPTGNRRFWIIPIPKKHKIDIDYLQAQREKLLGWAVWKYLDGESCVLPEEFKELQAEANKQWDQDHLWEEVLAGFLDRQNDVSTLECLREL
ncbi:MAG: VapE domain-containing protein, partial [Microcystis panniformis]